MWGLLRKLLRLIRLTFHNRFIQKYLPKEDISNIVTNYDLKPDKKNDTNQFGFESGRSKKFPKKTFQDPHKHIDNIQLKAARAILANVGGEYLPLRLISILKDHDAFTAVYMFLSELMGFNYQSLLDEKEKQETLQNYLDILLHADLILKDSKLDDTPIYEAIQKRDNAMAESYIDRLDKISHIIKNLKNSTIIFKGEFLELKKEAEKILSKWHEVDDEAIKKITKWYKHWLNLQNKFNEYNAEIDEKYQWITNNFPEAIFHEVKSVKGEEIKKIRESITQGENIEQGIGELKEILDQLEYLIEEHKDKQSNAYSESQTSDEEKTSYQKKEREPWEWIDNIDDEEFKYTKAYYIFGFSTPYPKYKPTEKELKKTYRSLARKYHPDSNPEDKLAEEKLKSINNAYDFLKERLSIK